MRGRHGCRRSMTAELSEIGPGPQCSETVRMIVETEKKSTDKYEYDSDLGVFRLDRVLYSPLHCPGDHGFIPRTIGEDGDPIDVLSLVDQPSFPGCVTDVTPSRNAGDDRRHRGRSQDCRRAAAESTIRPDYNDGREPG